MAGIDSQSCASVLLMPSTLLVFNQEAYATAQAQMASGNCSSHIYKPPPPPPPLPSVAPQPPLLPPYAMLLALKLHKNATIPQPQTASASLCGYA